MTKQEETNKLLFGINETLNTRIINHYDGIQTALLCDIAKSLSIIADKMQESERK